MSLSDYEGHEGAGILSEATRSGTSHYIIVVTDMIHSRELQGAGGREEGDMS